MPAIAAFFPKYCTATDRVFADVRIRITVCAIVHLIRDDHVASAVYRERLWGNIPRFSFCPLCGFSMRPRFKDGSARGGHCFDDTITNSAAGHEAASANLCFNRDRDVFELPA